MGIFKRDGEYLDPEFARFLKKTDGAKFWADHAFDNRAHPTDRNRTLLGDLSAAVKKIQEKQEAKGKPGEFDVRDMKKVMSELGEVYGTETPFKGDEAPEEFAKYSEQ